MTFDNNEIVETLNRDGIWISPEPYPYIDELVSYVKSLPAYSGHVKPQGAMIRRTFEEAIENKTDLNSGFVCHDFEEIIRAPHLFDYMMQFNDAAVKFFHPNDPNFYAINAMWKKPDGAPGWHYDKDGNKLLVFFMYGSDILKPEDGPHCFLKGSHKWLSWRRNRLNDKGPDVEPGEEYKDNYLEIYGKKGTFFLSNPWALHNGRAPHLGHPARLLFWGRWSDLNPPKTYHDDRLHPVMASTIPMDEKWKCDSVVRKTTKLLVDWDV